MFTQVVHYQKMKDPLVANIVHLVKKRDSKNAFGLEELVVLTIMWESPIIPESDGDHFLSELIIDVPF